MNEMAFSLTLRLVALCLLPLVTCESAWTEDYYRTLTNKWDRCKFPPNGTRTGDILGICTRDIISSTIEDETLRGIKYLCSLFEKFSFDKCIEAEDSEIEDSSKMINMLLSDTAVRKLYTLCDAEAGFKIQESVLKALGDKTCKLSCSLLNAEKLCQLIIILSIADYEHMEDAAKDLELKTTTETQTTVPDSVATTSSTINEGSKTHPLVSPNGTISAETETETTKTNSTETTNETTKTNSTETTNEMTKIIPTVKPTTEPAPTTSGKGTEMILTAPVAGFVTTGQLAIYGISFFLLGAIVFATYKYRHSILSCLRENQTPGPSGKDGKGGYRKVPNFERVLPNMEDREKAKSFIY